MKTKTLYSAVLTMAAVVLLAPGRPVGASENKGRIEVGPFVGYNIFQPRQNLKDRHIVGGRLGYNFTNHLGVEGTLAFTSSPIDDESITGAEEGQFRSPMKKVGLTFYHIDMVYHFMSGRKVIPFVLAGSGGAHYNPNISSRNMTAFAVGAGAKYWVADNIALRFDLRQNVVSELFQSRKLQEHFFNVNATVGMAMAFGGAPKPAPARVVRAAPAPPPAPEKVTILVSEPKVVERVQVLTPEPKIVILAFEDVHFDFDKATLTESARMILRRSVRILQDNPEAKVRIAGYTSAAGTEEYNQRLSERRATAVKEYLLAEGVVTPGRLATIGYGENRPAEYEAAPRSVYSKSAKANMRVLFEIIVE